MRLAKIMREGVEHSLQETQIGLEKESLRVSPDGHIAQTDHPRSLGSALTHPNITTDYSEALLEFVTPPFASVNSALKYLNELQTFVYQQLENEFLWATSMPCVIGGEQSIRIAEYGSSNIGRMKNVYRRGLGHRYGKTMQVIAGVHFNYSYPDSFWAHYREALESQTALADFKNQHYFALTRNLLRFSWLIPYLFGASPAVCKSFFGGKETNLKEYDQHTYYEPYATSLRVADIGYQNNLEEDAGLYVDYSSLETYVSTLKYGIETPHSVYEAIGVKKDGQWQQLNANILQIENEYYSAVRPKPLLNGNQKPTSALRERGTQYIELRLLDVNAFDPLGINETQLYFLEGFILFCLLHESPPIQRDEYKALKYNQNLAARSGRDPDTYLWRQGQKIKLRDWAYELCQAMEGFFELLDTVDASNNYTQALKTQTEAVLDANLTPSARMLACMKESGEGFYEFALRMSQKHQRYFQVQALSDLHRQQLVDQVQYSLEKQQAIETADKMSFEQFLDNYFKQP